MNAKTEQPEFKVPMSSPDLNEADRRAVAEVLDTPRLSMGPQTKAFEAAVCAYGGRKHAISVSSGTAGLHLCVRAAEVEAGDLVITTPFSFVSSTTVLLFENAIPVFVDVDPHTGNIDPEQAGQAAADLAEGGKAAEKWLPRRWAEVHGELKALLPIDVFGQPYDHEPIQQIAQGYGLKVIEDSCEAIGAQYKGQPAGGLGDYGVFAFYPNKQMTTGEGGVVVTDDEQAATFMRALRNQGRAPGDTWLDHTHLGYNYRMDEMSAALGRSQIGRLDELLEKRATVAAWYKQRLAEIPAVEPPQIVETTTRMSWFVYVIRVAPNIDRDALIEVLAQQGIPARPYFSPIHLHPFMRQRFGYQEGDYPVTEDLGRRGLALPFSSVMSEAQVDLVCQSLHAALTELS